MAEEDRLSFLVQYRDKFATDCQRVFRGFQVQPSASPRSTTMAAIRLRFPSLTPKSPYVMRLLLCDVCCGVQGRKRVWALTKNKVWWHSKWFYDAIQVPSPSPSPSLYHHSLAVYNHSPPTPPTKPRPRT